MKKKTLLIFVITLIFLLALVPSAGSVLADGAPHKYAYGQYPSEEPGVWGHNYVYNNDVYSYFVADFVAKNYSQDQVVLRSSWQIFFGGGTIIT